MNKDNRMRNIIIGVVLLVVLAAVIIFNIVNSPEPTIMAPGAPSSESATSQPLV